METTRSISKVTTNFFYTLDVHASKLNKILEETQTVQDQQLCDLEKKFEVALFAISNYLVGANYMRCLVLSLFYLIRVLLVGVCC